MRIKLLVFSVIFIILLSFLLYRFIPEKNEFDPVLGYFKQEVPKDSPLVFGLLHDELTQELIKSRFRGREVYIYSSLSTVKYKKGTYLAVIIFDRNSPYAKGILKNSERDWNVFISMNINKLELKGQKYFQEIGTKAEIYLVKHNF